MTYYCYQCGHELETRMLDNRERETCSKCGWVHYLQLKVGAAVLIEHHNTLLLLLRNHEPWKGSWMIPAGYVEADEDPKDAARREVREETGLEVELGDLINTYYFDDDPRGNGIAFLYKATKISGNLHLSDEAGDARYFAPDKIPEFITKAGQDKIIYEWQVEARRQGN